MAGDKKRSREVLRVAREVAAVAGLDAELSMSRRTHPKIVLTEPDGEVFYVRPFAVSPSSDLKTQLRMIRCDLRRTLKEKGRWPE